MAEKIGSEYFRDMKARGWRELGGALFPDSNIAQPMYPPRGGYANTKEAEAPATEEPKGSVIEDRLAQAGQDRDDHGKEDRGMDRE
jgi:hypothetical protein